MARTLLLPDVKVVLICFRQPFEQSYAVKPKVIPFLEQSHVLLRLPQLVPLLFKVYLKVLFLPSFTPLALAAFRPAITRS
jgi:hypothetical protein